MKHAVHSMAKRIYQSFEDKKVSLGLILDVKKALVSFHRRIFLEKVN